MQQVRRFRLPALFCAFAVLVCELISHPYAEMGVSDDLAYVVSAHKLATTGHIVYVGAAAAMLGAQLYIGAAMIKLFGFSFSAVRIGTLLVAMTTAFLLQRIMVRSDISERNATIGTLALVLSPLFLMLSATYMSDMYGLFALVLCLYCCLRALQTTSSTHIVAWLGLAVTGNAIFGTARQIAWLGILVMVPSTLFLLQRRRRVLLAGVVFTLAGAAFIFGCMAWFHRQPYTLGLPSGGGGSSLAHTLGQFSHTFLDIPFLLLPLIALFIPEIRKSSRRMLVLLSAVTLSCGLLAFHWRHAHPDFLLEPTQHDWVTRFGTYESIYLQGVAPLFINTGVSILLTVLSIGGLLGLMVSLMHSRGASSSAEAAKGVSWVRIGVLLAPFTVAYIVLLIPSARNSLFDRYTLELLVVIAICLLRYYQDHVQPRLPLASVALVVLMGVCGIAMTHNTFAFYRARVRLGAELRSDGVPDTAVDNGWEYNFGVELRNTNHINDPGIVLPSNAYVPPPPPPAGSCKMNSFMVTPHIHPIYGVSFDPNACYGPAPFAPIHYSRWLASTPGTLYVVNYIPPSKQQ